MEKSSPTPAAKGMRATIKALERHQIHRFQAVQVRPHVWRIGIAYVPKRARDRNNRTS